MTQLAMLLAGMASDEKGVRVDARRVQPGHKAILGETYTDKHPMAEINRLITNVALRPETAQNVAFTLARHFIADDPPSDLVDALAATYLKHDSALLPVYRVLLKHPAAKRHPTGRNCAPRRNMPPPPCACWAFRPERQKLCQTGPQGCRRP